MASPSPAAQGSTFARHLTIIVVIALAARVAVFFYAWQNFALFDFPDSHRYIAVARNILAGHGPIDSPEVLAGTDPAYPYLIAAGGLVGIESDRGLLLWGRGIASLGGWLIVPALALLARRLTGDRTALVASAWAAVDPMSLFFGATALTDLPFTFLMVAACIALMKGVREGRHGVAVFAGLLLGLGALMRSTAFFLPLAFIPFVVMRLRRQALVVHRRSAKSVAIIACLLLGHAVVLSPLVWRQHRVLGEWRLPIRTGGGASLLEAIGPWADGGPGMDRIAYPPVSAGANELERDRVHRRHAIDWARAHPSRVVELAWAKLKRTWSIRLNAADYQSPLYLVIAWLTVAPVFALAVAGVWIERRRVDSLMLLLAPAVYFTLLHMVFVGSIRYRLPAMPFLFILAAVAAIRPFRSRFDPQERA